MRTISRALLCGALFGLAAGCIWLAAGCGSDDQLGSRSSAIDISLFKLPSYSLQQHKALVRQYDAFDAQNQVTRGLLEDALLFFERNKAHIPKKATMVVLDFALFSGKNRFWVVDMQSGAVSGYKTAHGKNSDPDHDGYATIFSNTSGSYKSSLGFALTAERYNGKYANSMRLDGLSASGSPNGMHNTAMRARAIVVHGASYVNQGSSSKQGRSLGCPALDDAISDGVVNKIYGGALFYGANKPLHAPVGRAHCGDGDCDGAETAQSCAVDCQPTPDQGVPTPDQGAPAPDQGAPAPDQGHPALDQGVPVPTPDQGGAKDALVWGADAPRPPQQSASPSLSGSCAVGGQGGAPAAVPLLLLGLWWFGRVRKSARDATTS